MGSTSFHRPRFPEQNHSTSKSVGRITSTTRRRPFRCFHSTLYGSTKLLLSSHTHPTRFNGFRCSCATSCFDPACLLTIPRLSNNWLTDNLPSGLADRTFAKWLKDLPVSDAQRNVLISNIATADTCWSNQHADAVETVQKVAVMKGIPVCQLQKNVNATNLIKLAPLLRKKLKHKVFQSYLHLTHAMILALYILTPFMSSTISLLFKGSASRKPA